MLGRSRRRRMSIIMLRRRWQLWLPPSRVPRWNRWWNIGVLRWRWQNWWRLVPSRTSCCCRWSLSPSTITPVRGGLSGGGRRCSSSCWCRWQGVALGTPTGRFGFGGSCRRSCRSSRRGRRGCLTARILFKIVQKEVHLGKGFFQPYIPF